jgi:hypothetical protein
MHRWKAIEYGKQVSRKRCEICSKTTERDPRPRPTAQAIQQTLEEKRAKRAFAEAATLHALAEEDTALVTLKAEAFTAGAEPAQVLATRLCRRALYSLVITMEGCVRH